MSAKNPAGEAAPIGRGLSLRLPRRTIGRPLRDGEIARVLPLAVPLTLLATGALVAALASLLAEPPPAEVLLGSLGLLGAAVIAEAFPLPLEGVNVGSTSLALVFVVATGVLYGWESAAVVAFVTMTAAELIHRRPAVRAVYNAANYVLAAVAAALGAAAFGDENLATLVLGAFGGATAFYLVNIALLAAVISRTRTQPVHMLARLFVRSTATPFLIMASLTATLVILWDRSPFASIVLVGPLLAIAFYQRWLYGALDRLRRFDRMKDEFIAVLSHEMRTPLTSVYGSALTLQQQELNDETRRTLQAVISNESARLGRLLDDLLAASRLDTGREKTLIMPTDARALVDDVVENSRQRRRPGIEVEVEGGDDLPPVAADPDKLRQVLDNLIENANKYSPDGGLVRVEVRRVGRFARFSVHDEGIGIPPYEQERIFDKFHRLDPNMTRGVGGTGLGLYICRQLVERMDGRIWVTSEEGRGSTFTFELPLDRAHPPARG